MQILFNLKSASAWICTIGPNWCSWLMDHGSDWSQRAQLMDQKNVPCTWLNQKHFWFGISTFSIFLLSIWLMPWMFASAHWKSMIIQIFLRQFDTMKSAKKSTLHGTHYTNRAQRIDEWKTNGGSKIQNDEQNDRLFVSPFPIKMNAILFGFIFEWCWYFLWLFVDDA